MAEIATKVPSIQSSARPDFPAPWTTGNRRLRTGPALWSLHQAAERAIRSEPTAIPGRFLFPANGRRSEDFEVAICDLKDWPRWPALLTVRLFRTRRPGGCQRAQHGKSSRNGDLCCTRVHHATRSGAARRESRRHNQAARRQATALQLLRGPMRPTCPGAGFHNRFVPQADSMQRRTARA